MKMDNVTFVNMNSETKKMIANLSKSALRFNMNLIKYATKKTLIFGFAGAIGALVAGGISELFRLAENHSLWGNIFHVIIWTGTIGLGIALSLLIAQNIYFKKNILSKSLVNAGWRGVLTGAAAGGIVQIVS